MPGDGKHGRDGAAGSDNKPSTPRAAIALSILSLAVSALALYNSWNNGRRTSALEADRAIDDAWVLLAGGVGKPTLPALPESSADIGGVESLVERALTWDDDNPEAYRVLGLYYQAADRPDEALEALDKAVDHAKRGSVGWAAALVNRGLVRQARGEPEPALADFRQAAEEAPGFALAHVNLGNALFERGNNAEAAAAFRDAIALHSKLATAHLGLGRALAAQDDVAGALAAFEQAVDADPRNPIGYVAAGQAKMELGDLDGALSDLELAGRLDASLPAVRWGLAEAYQRLAESQLRRGRADEALAAYQAAHRIEPDHVGALLGEAEVLFTMGRFAEAVERYERVAGLTDEIQWLDDKLAEARRRAGSG